MSFLTVYKDPKKKRLQQVEILLMIVLLPFGLYFGYGAYQEWSQFKASEVHSLRGQELIFSGNFEEGLKEFQTSAELYPGNPFIWEAIGVVYHDRGLHLEEAEAYLSGMKANPTNGDLAREYATALHELAQHEKELEYLRLAESLGTNDALFLSRLVSRAQREADGTLEPSLAKVERLTPHKH